MAPHGTVGELAGMHPLETPGRGQSTTVANSAGKTFATLAVR